jgi:hypothetical protein
VVVGDYEGMKVLSIFKQVAGVPELFFAFYYFGPLYVNFL